MRQAVFGLILGAVTAGIAPPAAWGEPAEATLDRHAPRT